VKEEQKREAVKKAQDLQYKVNELQRDVDEANSGVRSAQQSTEGAFAEVLRGKMNNVKMKEK
jgi:hypothetical protein